MKLLKKNEERLIKAISKVIGIKEEKIQNYSQNNEVLNLLKRPKTIEPTKLQMERINLLNEFLVNYSITKEFSHKKEISFTNSKEVGEYFKYLIGNKKDKEVFMCAFLDRNNQLIDIKKISEGTLSAAIVFPREIVKEVLDTKCKSVVFCHNHPSGNTEPSDEDIALTNNLANIISPLGIKVIDHVIVGDDITSLKDRGVIGYDKDHQFIVNTNEEDYTAGKEYYKNHVDMFIESLLNLADIDPKKINNYLNSIPQESNSLYTNNIISIVEDPTRAKDTLNLNKKELNKLKIINDFLQNYNSLTNISKAKNKINGPTQMARLFKEKVKDEGKEDIYLMLYNSKLVLLGVEKITNTREGNIVLSPKDILSKTLAYDAAIISLVHTNSPNNYETTNLAMEIAQNLFNILRPLHLNIIDYLIVDDKNFTSLKEKGLMPYTVIGMGDYKKVNIGIDKDYHEEIENDEYEMEF